MNSLAPTLTLRKTSETTGLSEAWIHKIEICFGLRKWASNVPGRKSTYDSFQIEFFKKVHFLRSVGLSLSEIKKMHDLENKIADIIRVDLSLDNDDLRGSSNESQTSYFELYLLEGFYGGTEGVEFNRQKYKSDGRVTKRLDNLRDEHKALLRSIYERAHNFYKDMGSNLERLKSYAK